MTTYSIYREIAIFDNRDCVIGSRYVLISEYCYYSERLANAIAAILGEDDWQAEQFTFVAPTGKPSAKRMEKTKYEKDTGWNDILF